MYFNALLLGDNIGIVAMLILYSIFFILKKKAECLTVVSPLFSVAGLVVKGVGLYMIKIAGTDPTFGLALSLLFIGKLGNLIGLIAAVCKGELN